MLQPFFKTAWYLFNTVLRLCCVQSEIDCTIKIEIATSVTGMACSTKKSLYLAVGLLYYS